MILEWLFFTFSKVLYLNISGIPPTEIMTFFQLAPPAIRFFVRLSRIILLFGGGLRPVASSGKEGPVITASHRDCRDRLTHENVIRISLLPTALRNDCSTSLCNVVSRFPSASPSSLVYLPSERPRQPCRSSCPSIARDPAQSRSAALAVVGQLSQRIDRPNVIGNWHLRGDRNWFLEMHDCARLV